MAAPASLMETSRITSSPPNSLEGSLGAAQGTLVSPPATPFILSQQGLSTQVRPVT